MDAVLGTRISELRRQLGVTQAEMARRIGISPSYLNLIERNKRRIAGALLRRTAEELGVRTEDLDGAHERRLADALSEISSLPLFAGLDVPAKSIPELVARFPGWAAAIERAARSERAAQDTARALSDRMAHDPFLGESVHGMLSRVAAIRAAAEILTEFSDLAESDQARFHSIIRAEVEALTETGEALATYFDRTDERETRLTPVDEIEALFSARENHFAELEAVSQTPGASEVAIEAVLADASQIETDAARHRARARLRAYSEDAAALPSREFVRAAIDAGCDVEVLAEHFDVGTDAICRRLASMPQDGGLPEIGYLQVNAAGTIVENMGLQGLTLPRYTAICPLWILFRAQQQPGVATAQFVEMPNGDRFVFVARARTVGTKVFGHPRHYVTDMLAMTAQDARATVYAPSADATPEPVGPSCRICPRAECAYRVADPLVG